MGVQDVLAVRSYQGDSKAGGSQSYGLTLDPSPFEKLAQYTYFQNRELWERKNKLDDANAIKVGELSALDPSSINPEIYKYFNDRKESLMKQAMSGALDYQKNPNDYIKFRKDWGDFNNQRTAALANQTKELQWENSIQSTDDPKLKSSIEAEKKYYVDKLYGDGIEAAFTQKAPLQTYNPVGQDVLGVPSLGADFKVQTIKIGLNDNLEIKRDFKDTNPVFNQSDQIYLGIAKDVFTPSEKAKSDPNLLNVEQKRYDIKHKELLNLNATVSKFNDFIQPFQQDLAEAGTDDEKFKAVLTKIKGTAGQGSDILLGILQSNWDYNKQARTANEELRVASTQQGKPVLAPYREINISDGLSGGEYIAGNKLYGIQLMTDYKTDVTHTGSGNQRRGQDLSLQASREDNATAVRVAKLNHPPAPTVNTADASYSGNVIYGVNTTIPAKGKETAVKIVNGVAYNIDAAGNITSKQSDFNGLITVKQENVNSNVRTYYDAYNAKTGSKNTLMEPDANGESMITYRFKDGVAIAVKTANGSFATTDDFAKVTDYNSQYSETKYNSETAVGVQPGSRGSTAPQQSQTIPTIDTKQEFDNLPRGATYIDKQTGKKGVKN